MSDAPYANIRILLGTLIGQKLIDITQHDREEWEEDQESYVHLMFEDGSSVKFFTPQGFVVFGPVAEALVDPGERT